MNEIIVQRAEHVPGSHQAEHPDYAYTKKNIVGRSDASQCVVSVYEVPPGKAAYPYHYHLKNEEVFYILQGQGELITPQGCRTVEQGDFLFFPSNAAGAHKLINTSQTELLTYIDFDTKNDIDVACYPDSKKIGVWGLDTNCVFHMDDAVDYYSGE